MERSYRQSGVARFQRCRRSYDLGYRRNLEPNGDRQHFSKTADVGTMYHSGLQAYYLYGDPVAAVEARGAEFLAQYPLDVVEVTKGITMARIMITGYMQWQEKTGMDQGWKVLLVEERIEIPIGQILGEDVTLSGQLDLAIEDSEGGVWVVDGKTCATFETYTFNIQQSPQLQFYDMLMRRALDITPVGAQYNMARRVLRTGAAKPPFYARENVRFNATQRRNYENQLLGQVEDMVRAELAVEADPEAHHRVMYPKTQDTCRWDCSFLNVCSMRDTGDAFEDAIADMYQQRTPIELTTKEVA